MSYNPNIPQPTERIADSQPQILGNFSYIQTAMQEDHAWNGNEINGQADGTHQQVSLPNQPADITGALPTGIAAIEYAIGGNLYTWNGAKNPVSGVSASGTFAIGTTFATIVTAPNNCIGFVLFQFANTSGSPLAGVCVHVPFFNIAGTLYVQPIPIPPPTGVKQVSALANGSNVQLAVISGSYTGAYKSIYWPI